MRERGWALQRQNLSEAAKTVECNWRDKRHSQIAAYSSKMDSEFLTATKTPLSGSPTYNNVGGATCLFQINEK